MLDRLLVTKACTASEGKGLQMSDRSAEGPKPPWWWTCFFTIAAAVVFYSKLVYKSLWQDDQETITSEVMCRRFRICLGEALPYERCWRNAQGMVMFGFTHITTYGTSHIPYQLASGPLTARVD